MAEDIFNEAKKRLSEYISENYPTTPEGKMYKEAKKRVKLKKSYYIHVLVFIPTIVLLAALSIFVTPQVWWWFLIPTAGWGVGLLAHYITAFGIPGIGRFDDGWEAHQLEKEYRKLKNRQEFENYLKEGTALKPEGEKLDLKELEKRFRDDDLV